MNKMDNMLIEMTLHDYRRDIVMQTNKEKWNDWDKWNILQKTLEYELDKTVKDVESYEFVKKKIFSSYCPNYKKEYVTADIMNGWWYCFKELFDHKIMSRQNDKEKIKINDFLEDLKGKDNKELVKLISNKLKTEYKDRDDKEKICESFIRFLKVVYTTGNMTPAPINPSQGRGLDTWEYKLGTYKEMYHDYEGDKEKLLFQDYCEQNVIKPYTKTADFKKYPAKYMNSRTELIIRRAYRVNVGQEISEDILKEIFCELDYI